MKQLAAIPEIPSTEDILLLTQMASTKRYASPPIQSAREKAWQRLSSLPDFPDQIIKSIHAERAKWKAGEWYSEYDRVRFGTIEAMKKLEHPGIVRILGELLWDTERTVGEFGVGAPSNAVYASRSLAEMVENPPVQRPPDIRRPGDLETWQLWYEQIRAGTRTFRFKGNPQEYNLQGPVTKAITPTGTTGSKASDSPGDEKIQEPEGKSFSLGLLAAALGVLGLAGFFAFRKPQGKAA